jgi:hypothetical protein
LPTPQERTAIERLFRALGAAGLLSVLDALYVGAATDVDSRLNLLGTSGTLTKTNAPVWTKYRGYKGNGTNASLDSGINPSTAPGLNYTLDSASLFGYVLSQPTVSAGIVGRGASPAYTFINPAGPAAKMYACVNETITGTSNSNATNPQKNGLGLCVAVRESAGAVKLYRGSSLIATGTSASTAIPNGTIRGLSGGGDFTDAELGAWGFGGAMTAAQVAALNTALRTYFSDLGQAVVDPATPYGVWRGTWDVGGNAIGTGGGVLFAARDVILYSGAYYFCISGYNTTSGSTAPNVDTTHWEPIPLFAEVTLFDDDFGDRPGAFSGRPAGAFTWTTTGSGYLNAQVVVPVDGDGYASSLENTYYQVVDITSPPTMIGAIESDAAEPHFTLAIGGSDVASWSTEMVHINFTATGADGRYWHAGEVGVNLTTGAKYSSTSGALSLTAGQKYQVEAHVRGNFLFGFLDGTLVYTVCNDIVGTIASVATEVYTQNQLQTDTGGVQYAFGDQKIYRVWCKASV